MVIEVEVVWLLFYKVVSVVDVKFVDVIKFVVMVKCFVIDNGFKVVNEVL